MNDHLTDSILKKIEEQRLAPTPRWQFLLTRTAFWVLAILSVVIGGVAFGVADYVFFDNDGINLSSLQDAPIHDIALSIPYLWLAVLGIFTYIAYKGFRKTRSGYRYTTVMVLCSSVVASVVLGMSLNAVDFGQSVHTYLLSHATFYDALIHSREDASD